MSRYRFKVESLLKTKRIKQEEIDEINIWLNHLYVVNNVNINTQNRANNTLTIPKLSDEAVALFLISCKNNVEATKQTIQAHYRCKRNSPELFNDRNIDEAGLKSAINTVKVSSIPVLTDDNNVVHFFKIHDTDYKKFDLVLLMKISYMILDISQQNHTNPPDGLIAIIDMKGVGLMHLTRFKPSAIKKYFEFLQDGLPIKLKSIHILNSVYFFDKIMNLIKVFMKSELIDMLKIHPPGIDMVSEFHQKYVPAKCLPREYGGLLPSVDELNCVTIQQFIELKEFYQNEEQQRRNP